MKGFIDEQGRDMSPCGTCKYKDKMTVESPCYNCIDAVDLALHKPNSESNFFYYSPAHPTEKGDPKCCANCGYYNEDRDNQPCNTCAGFSNWEEGTTEKGGAE